MFEFRGFAICLRMTKKDFFISYNHVDKLWAAGLAEWLQQEGFSIVLQQNDFSPGSNFVLEMDRALKTTDRMIAVLSPDYLTSTFTAPEWAGVFARDPMGKKRRLIPVVIRECEIDGLLGQIVYINLVGLSANDARKRFLDGIRFAVTDVCEELAGSVDSTSRPSKEASINQNITGSHNVQAAGNVYINKKDVKKNFVTREPGEITDAQARTIQELIEKIVELQSSASKKTKSQSFGEWHQRLKNRYRVTSYKKVRAEDFQDVVSWLKQQSAMLRPKLRRANNAVWRKEHYKGIYARWRQMGYEKNEIYAFAFKHLVLKKPINSLKELGERNLEKLHKIIAQQM